MSILRTIKCDLCGATHTEVDNGSGFPGWCIIQGIGLKERKEDDNWEYEHLNTTLCPEHTSHLTALITSQMETEED